MLDELAKLTHAELFYGSDNFARKDDYPYHLFTRESIFFSRRCELYHGISRQYTYDLMKNVRESLDALSKLDLFYNGVAILFVQAALQLFSCMSVGTLWSHYNEKLDENNSR